MLLEVDCRDDIPDSLFLQFHSSKSSNCPVNKLSVVIDRTVVGHNQIEIVKSPYSTNMQFLELKTFPSLIRLFQNQQNLDITKNQNEFSYITNSRNESGPPALVLR